MNICLDVAISQESLVPCLLVGIIFKFINYKFELIVGVSCQVSNKKYLDQRTLAYDASLCFSFRLR